MIAHTATPAPITFLVGKAGAAAGAADTVAVAVALPSAEQRGQSAYMLKPRRMTVAGPPQAAQRTSRFPVQLQPIVAPAYS